MVSILKKYKLVGQKQEKISQFFTASAHQRMRINKVITIPVEMIKPTMKMWLMKNEL